jgi:hypothetical protein
LFYSSFFQEDTAQEQPRPQYVTRAQYEQQRKSARSSQVTEDGKGVKVTKSQRFFLVATGLFSRMSDVPEYVP